jgi:hypothetical protein
MLRRRFDTIALQDTEKSASREVVSQGRHPQFAYSPVAVLYGDFFDQRFYFCFTARAPATATGTPTYFRAISFRCHASKISGLTIVAT